MPSIADLLVRVGADVSELQSALRQSQGDLNAFKGHVEEGAVSLGKLGLAASAAGAAILAFLGVSVKAASDSQKEILLLEQALRASGRAADSRPYTEQALALQRLTGVSDEAIVSIQRLFVNVGASEEKILRLTPAILDFAAATGQDATGAAATFSRALAGLPLRGLAKAMTDGISLTEDFEGAMRALERSVGGASEVMGRTLPGALGRLREAFDNVLEVIGEPLLAPVTAIVKGMAAILERVEDVARTQPLLTAAFSGATAAMGVFLLGLGASLTILPRVALLMASLTKALIGVNLAAVVAAGGLTTLQAVMVRLAILAPQVALVAVIGAAIVTLAKMIQTIREVDAVERRFAQTGREMSGAVRDRIKDVSALEKALTDAASGFKLIAAESKAASAALAAKRLQTAGLTAQQIEKIERDRAAAVVRADREEIRSNIAKTKEIISQLRLRIRALGEEPEVLKRLEAAQQSLHDLTIQLNDSMIRDELEVAKARADAVERLKELKIRAETEAVARTTEILKGQLAAIQDVERERVTLEEQGRQRRLAMVRLENELRISALRNAFEIQRGFEEAALGVRESISRARGARAEAQAVREAQARVEALRLGLVTEDEAQKQADESRRKRLLEQTQAELDLANRRLALIAGAAERERAVVEAEFQAKVDLLDLETQAEIDAAKTRESLRELELRSAIQVARAETAARKAEIGARLDAEIVAAEAAAVLARSPEERRVHLEQADRLAELQRRALQEQDRALMMQQDALAQSLVITQQGALQEIDVLSRQSALKRRGYEQELHVALSRITTDSIRERADAVAQLADIELHLTRELADEEENLNVQVRAGKITQADADRRLKPLRDLAAVIQRVSSGELLDVDKALGDLASWKTGVKDRIAELKPLVDALGGMGRNIPIPGGQIGPQPAGVAVMAGAGAISNVFTFQGTTFNLTPEEGGLLRRIVQAIMGPEFNKEVSQYFRSLPGPRVPG